MSQPQPEPAQRKRGRPRIHPPKVRAKRGPDNRIIFDPELHCGAKTTSTQGHEPCRNVKGFRTPHPGESRCWKHGGLTPIKTGIYSKVRGTRLKDLIEKVREKNADPLDVVKECLLVTRAMTTGFIEDHSELDDPEAIMQAADLLFRTTRIAGRVNQMEQVNMVHLDVVRLLHERMASVVMRVVKDPNLIETIKDQWGRIQVERCSR